MALATELFRVVAGVGIETDGREVGLKDPNEPGGAVVLNDNGAIELNSLQISVSASEAANQIVPLIGELVFKDRTLIIGDDDTPGGLPCNLEAQGCCFVAADGDAAHNDTVLRAAVDRAGDLSPFGSAASATNMRTVILGPGTYDLTANDAGHINLPNYVRLKALIPGTVRIIGGTSNQLALRQTDSAVEYVNALEGLEFVGISVLRFDFAQNVDTDSPGFLIDHRKLRFTGLSDTQNTIALNANNGGVIGSKRSPKISGYAIDCHTTGRRFFGGHSTPASATSFTYDIHFENCISAGSQSFGSLDGTPFGAVGILEGTYAAVINCKMGGATNTNWSTRLNCPFIGNEWNGAIQRLDTSAYLRNSVIRGVVSSHSINHNAAVNVKMFNLLLADAIGTNVTNLLGSASDTFIRISSAA